jgi:hypothetical protein
LKLPRPSDAEPGGSRRVRGPGRLLTEKSGPTP